MSIRSNHKAGFGAIAVVAIIAVVLIVAGAGFVVYKKSGNKPSESNSATTPAGYPGPQQATPAMDDQPVKPQTAQKYLVIKEWDVQMRLDGNTSSLYYVIKPELPNVAYLSMTSVSNIAPKCSADQVSLAAVSRLTEEEQQAALSKPRSVFNRPGTVHIGSYWYLYTTPNAGCVENQGQSEAIKKLQLKIDVEPAFKTLEAVPAASGAQ